VENKILYMRS